MSFKKHYSICCVIFIFILIYSSTVFAIDCNSNEPDFRIHGLCFNPYRDGQGPGSIIDPNQIQEMLETISPYIQWVRSYSATHGLEEIPVKARDWDLNVAMGAWIRDSGRDAELRSLSQKAGAGYVDIAVIGNEELYANTDPNQLLAILQQIHSDPNFSEVSIAITEPWDVLFRRNPDNSFKYQEILDSVDIFIVNIYPFHEQVSIDQAINNLQQIYNDVLADANEAGPGKEVIIGETGWPSEGETKGEAVPSLENAAYYFYKVIEWAKNNQVQVFYFSAYDESWKGNDVTPPIIFEKHWGIWDSSGSIKSSFLPDYVFCENFDPLINTFWTRKHDNEPNAPDPNVCPADSDSDGQFLRLLYDGNMTEYCSAAFERAGKGAFERIIAEFDFRLFGDGVNADGFSFLLMPTSVNSAVGRSQYNFKDYPYVFAESPRILKTFGIGFCCYKGNSIKISWDGRFYPEYNGSIWGFGVDLDSGQFHRARIELQSSENNTALVNVDLIKDVYGTAELVNVVDQLIIGDPNHPYRPYENRVEFIGRNGGLDMNADIDNVYVSYKYQACYYLITGDLNDDCRIDILDFAILAQNWLISCDLTPSDPACTEK